MALALAAVVGTGGLLVVGPPAPVAAATTIQSDVRPSDATCQADRLHPSGTIGTCGAIDITSRVLVDGVDVAPGTPLAVGAQVTVSLVVAPEGGDSAMYAETVDGIRNNQYDSEALVRVGLPSQTGSLLSAPTGVTMSRTDLGSRGSGPAINCLAQNGQDPARTDPATAVALGGAPVGLNGMQAGVSGSTLTARWTTMSADRCVTLLSNNGWYPGFSVSFTQTVLAQGATAQSPTWSLGALSLARKDGSRALTWGSSSSVTLGLPAAPATVPGAPTIGTATAGDGQATVTWTAPASDGGSPLNGYVVTPYVGGVAQPTRTFAAGATSGVVTGLQNGTAYTFRVAARNVVGTGPQSAATAAVTPQAPATVPGAPTIGSVTAGDGQATVTWTAPASDGGSPLNGYVVTPYVGGVAQPTRTFAAGATSGVVTGLQNGTAYTFRVAARNVVGTGPQSADTAAVTPQAPVVAPAPWAPFASADDFTRQQHLDLAGRLPTAAELTTWRTALTGGTATAADLIEGLRAAAYWEGELGPLVRLYRAVFLRNPDTAGLEFWEGRSRGGQDLSSIATFFARGQEFVNRYGSVGDEAFVTLVYANVLGRAPDAAGAAFWRAELARGVSRGKLVLHFSNSLEYRGQTASRVAVVTAWYGLLRRVPTNAEADAAVARLAGGGTIQQVIADLLATPEYAARLT